MTEIEYTRQREFFDPAQHNAAVTIVGCGGIGSFTALALAKLGVKRLDLIDFDTVEAHNFPNQMFAPSMIGNTKVDMVADQVRGMNPDIEVAIHNTAFNDLDAFPYNDIVIAALDSMEARAALWQLIRMKFPVKLFLDGRLAGQKIVLYSVKPCNRADITGYEESLYTDEEAIEDSCTARSIIDVGFQVASLLTRAVRLQYTSDDRQDPITYFNQETLQIEKGEWL